MVKHNNVIVNVHLRKHWERIGVKTHFNQAAQKAKRHQIRKAKAARVFPRPANTLRPIVSQTTRKYAGKVRLGRGFTLQELKAAGVTARNAKTIGISVDHRRTTTSQEQLDMNVNRLKAYTSKLVLFPRRENKPKKGFLADSTADKLKAAHTQPAGVTMPIQKKESAVEFAKITAEDQKRKVYHSLRSLRTNQHYHGRRIKRKEDEEKKKE
jgi:large subunit ribosomal protein L13e